MPRFVILAAAASLALAGCTANPSDDPSAAPAKPKDFCHAMSAAVDAAAPAADSLDALFTTIDELAASATAVEIDQLNTAGSDTVALSQTYADTLGAAAQLAPNDALATDLVTLQDYWILYAIGLGEVAANADSYGDLIDQSEALVTSDQAAALVAEQPQAQQRINDGYLGECTS